MNRSVTASTAKSGGAPDVEPAFADFVRDLPEGSAIREKIEILERQASAGRLAAGVAHEFNNILTAMLGWTQIARRSTGEEDPTSSALATIEQNARRAKQIASLLLDLSRRGTIGRSTGLFSLGKAAEEALGLLKWELNNAGIKAIDDGIDTSSRCRGDATHIVQIFVNLLLNARDALGERGGTVRVSVRESEGWAEATVEDDGPGIDPGAADRIFEPFFSTRSPSTRARTGGTGLGLYICHRIAEVHGGTISASRSAGGGASFTVRLPVAAGSCDEAGTPPIVRSVLPAGTAVLVVDDERDIGEMVRTALELRGARVRVAESGERAVDACRRDRFDAAFVDFSMVGLSGHDLARALAEIRPEMPVLFMSGREIAPREAGNVVGFVRKPFDLGEIQLKLQEVLGDEGEG